LFGLFQLDDCIDVVIFFQQRDRAEKLQEESKGGAKPNTPMKRRLGTTGLRTHIESPNAKHRKLLVPAPSVNEVEHILKDLYLILTISQKDCASTAPKSSCIDRGHGKPTASSGL